MLTRALLPALNHVLKGESWAREKLRPHAGAQIRLLGGLFDLQLGVDEQGYFLPGTSAAPADVTLTLPDDLPLRLLTQRDSLFSSVKLAGSVELAETLGFVFRNLSWDVEADLAQMIGDIAAHRLVRLGRSLADNLRNGLQRTGENLAEFLGEESGMAVAREEIANFTQSVSTLRDDVARLEKRLRGLA